MKCWEIRLSLAPGVTSTWTVAHCSLSGAIREARRRCLDAHGIDAEPLAWKEVAL